MQYLLHETNHLTLKLDGHNEVCFIKLRWTYDWNIGVTDFVQKNGKN